MRLLSGRMKGRSLTPALSPKWWIIGLSALGLFVSAFTPRDMSLSSLCGQLDLGALIDPAVMALALAEPDVIVFGWLVMLLAMMPLLFSPVLAHSMRSSILRYRFIAGAAAACGYTIVWIAAATLLLPMAILLRAIFDDAWSAMAAGVAIALTWSASPWAQQIRNWCHRTRRLSARGAFVARDNFVWGFRSGELCVLACWPWMALPLLVEDGHTIAMALATAIAFIERSAPARFVRWRCPACFSVLLVWIRRTGSSPRYAEVMPIQKVRGSV